MPKVPGVNHLRAIKAFEKAGFKVVRQGKHIVMSDGPHFITIPRHNPVNAITMLFSYRVTVRSLQCFEKR